MSGKNTLISKKNTEKISLRAIAAFCVTLTLCLLLIGFTVMSRNNLERLAMEQLIMEKSVKISDVISKMVYKTEALAALVIQNDGKIENFEKVAQALLDDPAILNVIIAPAGVVTNVYPLQGNEAVLGFDLFVDGETTEESVLARETGQLTFGGPFNIVQGGQALIGRLPIWIDHKFWGFVNVTLKYPDALNGAMLGDIETRGLCYEIWRITPNTYQKQVITRGDKGYNENMRFIQMHIPILNADWYFRIAPINHWYEYPETWILTFIGLCMSFLVAFVVQNNSELKQVKSELEAKIEDSTILAEELNKANCAKTTFLANMSHEIRTPMNGIIGFLELVNDNNLPQETKDYLDKIKISATGLLDIVNSILDISKVESGKMDLELIPFSISELFKICEIIISPKAMGKNIVLYSYADPLIEEKLLGDPTKLRQILLNLLSNAIKFTDTGMVKFMAVVQNSSEDSMRVYFEIRDSGIGMTSEEIQKIFEPFAQADISTARRYGGTGLGLAISKNMIELMGGELKVESVPGAGSKFSFALTFEVFREFTDTFVNETKPESQVKKPTFRGNVLVCEDNKINQQVIKKHLSRVGLNSVIAENGKIGVDTARRQMIAGKPFDLILMDIYMPVMGGLEAAKKLNELGNKTPIVALTANIMPEDKENYREYGMSVCLGKPFKAKELWACLLKYLTPVELTIISVVDKDSSVDSSLQVIDRQLGIEQIAGDEKLYNRILANFIRDNKTTFQELNTAIESGDINLAHRIAHNLKSLAGTIGATRLAGVAMVIENILSVGNFAATKERMRDLEFELNAVLKELDAFAGNTETPQEGAGVLDREKALELINRLESLLELGNSESLELISEIKEILAPIGEKCDILITQMDAYDFELAFETLIKIKESLKEI